jgi:hypothetical protein
MTVLLIDLAGNKRCVDLEVSGPVRIKEVYVRLADEQVATFLPTNEPSYPPVFRQVQPAK